MNEDQFKGSWQQFKRKLKKRWGQLTDHDLLGVAGDATNIEGLCKNATVTRKKKKQRAGRKIGVNGVDGGIIRRRPTEIETKKFRSGAPLELAVLTL